MPVRLSLRPVVTAAAAVLATTLAGFAFADGGPFNHCRCTLPGAAPHVTIGVGMLAVGVVCAALGRRRRSPHPDRRAR